MKHIGTKDIEIPKYYLRKLEIEDANEMFECWCNDPIVTRYLPWDVHGSVDVTKELLNIWINEYEKNDTYRWIVEDKQNHNLIGTIDVVNIDNNNKVMEIGYCYRRNYWGKGVASTVLKIVIEYLFNNTDVDIITAKHLEPNLNSGKVMQRCGMKYDGVLRKRVIDKLTNERIGQAYYSITRDEYNIL